MEKKSLIIWTMLTIIFALAIGSARAEVPDYGNDCNSAEPIDPNGTMVEGTLSPTGDEDWFSFTAAAQGLYEITLHSQSGYKYLQLYGPDECGTPQRIATITTSTGTKNEEIFISYAGTYYARVYQGSGLYRVSVDELGVYDTDTYADICTDADELVVDGDPAYDGITDWGLDEDWLTFGTVVLHKYQITLTRSFTSNIAFDLYTQDCATNLKANRTTTLTFVSLDGANYNLRVHSSNFTQEGYYEIQVEDLGEQPDDYGNTCDTATPIDTNGAELEGALQYSADLFADEDWFSFTASAHGLYEITLHSQSGYKYLEVYGPDECGTPQRIATISTSTGTKSEQLFISYAGTYYARVYYGSGLYHVSVTELGVYDTDTYPDTCFEAAPLDVNGIPAYDGITDWGNDEDWFTIPTGVLHKYEVTLDKSFTSDVVFDLYDYDCETNLKSNRTSITFVSWYGANYFPRVHSSSFGKEGFYGIWVADLRLQPDDHGNVWYQSTQVETNGVEKEGNLQYTADIGSDEDWFYFLASLEGLYQITLWSQSGYKYLVLYRYEEPQQLQEITSFYTSTEVTKDVSITPGVYALKVHKGTGLYRVGVLSPEPQCGDPNHPYPTGDLNQDCVVNFKDVAVLANNWLADNRP